MSAWAIWWMAWTCNHPPLSPYNNVGHLHCHPPVHLVHDHPKETPKGNIIDYGMYTWPQYSNALLQYVLPCIWTNAVIESVHKMMRLWPRYTRNTLKPIGLYSLLHQQWKWPATLSLPPAHSPVLFASRCPSPPLHGCLKSLMAWMLAAPISAQSGTNLETGAVQ